MIHSLYILNRAGGLIYQQDYTNVLNKLSINDYLVFAGTIHGVHAIASKLTPVQVKDSSTLVNNSTAVASPNITSPNTPRAGSAANTPRLASASNFGSGGNDHDGHDDSRINKILANFTNMNNPQVTNASLLSSSSVSFNKLSTNFFYTTNNVSGLNVIETSFFNIFIFQTLTGVKFILITSPNIHEKSHIGAHIGAGPDSFADVTTVKDTLKLADSSVTSLAGSKSSLGLDAGSSTGAENKNLNEHYRTAEELLRKIYVVYSDYVMKNPFYSLDMPIKADLFDTKVGELIAGF